MVKNIVKKILTFLIKATRIHVLLMEEMEKEKIKISAAHLIGEGILLSKEATIENLSGDRKNIVIGPGTCIKGELLVWKHGGKIQIGENSYIGPQVRIWSGSKEGIHIGNNVLISHNVTIIDSDSHEIDHLERAKSFKQLMEHGHPEVNHSVKVDRISIRDYAWISYNVSILKGITIGEGAIIGAGSVVTKDVPDYTMVAGNPARVIKNLKEK